MSALSAIDVVMDMEDTFGGDEYCGDLNCSRCKRVAAAFLGLKNASDAVAEYIAANDELISAKFGLARARYNGDSVYEWVDGVARAEIRHAAAHARMKGETK